MEPGEGRNARLFFALWPEAQVRGLCAEHARELAVSCGGRAMRAQAIHLTLLFAGKVPEQRIAELTALAALIQAPAFTLILERRGSWKQIGWLAPKRTPVELEELSAALRAQLRHAEIAFDSKSFNAHVTIVRDARRPIAECAIDPIIWPVAEFALVRSHLDAHGSRYEGVGRWRLRSNP